MVTSLRGTVLERDGSVYRVATDAGIIRAVLRGKAKRETRRVVVGDRVQLDEDAGSGEMMGITTVEERRSLLQRRVPEGRGSRPVAANLDQVLVVTATRDPAPILQLLDRLLVVAESNDIGAAIILNKCDLDPGDALAARFQQAGYDVFRTSVRTGEGLDQLRDRLKDKESVVTGPSGAGKSSLLNALQPGLKLPTGEISRKVKRGTNVTVSAIMIPLDFGGFLVDTPGFSEVGLWGIEPADLAACFPEIRPLVDSCKYADCRHTGEPGCAVARAVEAGSMSADRLESYRRLLRELNELPKEWE